MTEKLFDEARIEAWRSELHRPVPLSDAEALAAPEVTGLTVGVMNMGITVRLRRHDGGFIDMTLNPVIASALMMAILNGGTAEGWLTHAGAVVSPDKPKDH